MGIAENVARIRAEMTAAALAAGREADSVLLCAATKMNDADAVKQAVRAGVDICAENRVQELLTKLPQGAYDGCPLHFIGRLQTNKVKYVVGEVSLIHSVDRRELLAAIEKQAAKRAIVQDILLEINIGGEASKSGFTPDEARAAAADMHAFPHCRLTGLMAIPPISQHPGDNRRFFAEMHHLFVDISEKTYDNVAMEHLSMGMSDDFADAICEGATIIRVGTAIFGPRNYTV